VTDADVAFHREGDRQPDRRVAARVAQPHEVPAMTHVPKVIKQVSE